MSKLEITMMRSRKSMEKLKEMKRFWKQLPLFPETMLEHHAMVPEGINAQDESKDPNSVLNF
ncbi:BAF_HP2_G0030790.mRNA.1.CDS.1 [Saccharomyces cerevisiae]|nr:BAF_HP2_G0030790.mRNA.1.CDS.1 [Saccharomyces cerevisiae]CAI6814804.1 BAF_HP2_G0030790.mRNA.1.CDS.1 [Saccharomyces cerevisiae]